jgi:hypothetical protein
MYYDRLVDDMFMIYNQKKKNTQESISGQLNKQNKALHFTITEEKNKQISYLDVNTLNRQGTIELDISRKPTITNITINNTSCHPG